MDDVLLNDRLYTVKQIRRIDSQITKLQFNNDDFVLMQRAGYSAFHKIIELYPQIKKIVVFCGQGNNGGDGFILASVAAQHGCVVEVFFLGNESLHTPASHKAYQQFQNVMQIHRNCKFLRWESGERALDPAVKPQEVVSIASDIQRETRTTEREARTTEREARNTETGDIDNIIYIDALFGIGLNREPEGEYKKAIDFINTKKNILALDIPSGLSADSGEVFGSCVKATHTVTFIALKQGLFTGYGPDYCGKLHLDTLGSDLKIIESLDYSSWLIEHAFVKKTISTVLPPRLKNSHKHQFGHVVIIGGGIGMPGAVVMAGLAALRVGAGLVSVITHIRHSSEINTNQPELMTYGLDEDFIAQQEAKVKIIELITKASIIVLGPGLGLTPWAEQVFSYSMEYILNSDQNKAILIDADGLSLLNELVSGKNYFRLLKTTPDTRMILTPHPGEAKRLLQHTHFLDDCDKAGQQSRFRTVTAIAEGYNAITILKGMGTLIAAPSNKTAICPYGNPGMSTAGAGDVLSGVIAGLVAQKLDNHTAAWLGVYLHSVAGDLQVQKFGERGLIATDLLKEIRLQLNS